VSIDLFVNGTLMRGLALHANLAGAEFLEACTTAPRYRLYSIGDIHPGMFEASAEDEKGVACPMDASSRASSFRALWLQASTKTSPPTAAGARPG